MKKNNKGFSLVELIIVIAIMVILVAILAPTFTKFIERSRLSTDVQNASEIATAVQVEYTSNPSFATTGTADTSSLKTLAVTPTAKSAYFGAGGSFTYAIDATTGAITVKVGSKQAYPEDAALTTELAK